MKNLLLLATLLSSNVLLSENYIMPLDKKHYDGYLKIDNGNSNEVPSITEYLTPHIVSSTTNAPYKYGCSTGFQCVDNLAGAMQVGKGNSLTLNYELDSEQTISGFDWYFIGGDGAAANSNKYPKNVHIYYYENNNWVLGGTVTGLKYTAEIIKYEIPFTMPASSRYGFVFSGAPNLSYTWLDYIKFIK